MEMNLPIDSLRSGIHKDSDDELETLKMQLEEERSAKDALAKELELLKEQLKAEKAEKNLPTDSLQSGIHKDTDEVKALKKQLEEEKSAVRIITGELLQLQQRFEAEDKFETSLHHAYLEEKTRVSQLLAKAKWKEEEYEEMDAEYEKMEADHKKLQAKLQHTEETLTKAINRLKKLEAEKVEAMMMAGSMKQLEAEKAEKNLPTDSLQNGIHKDSDEVAELLERGKWKEEEYGEMDAEYEKMEADHKTLQAKHQHTEETLTNRFKQVEAEKVEAMMEADGSQRCAQEQERSHIEKMEADHKTLQAKLQHTEETLTNRLKQVEAEKVEAMMIATAFQIGSQRCAHEQERSHMARVLEEEWRNHAAKVEELAKEHQLAMQALLDSSFASVKVLLQVSTGQKNSWIEEADYEEEEEEEADYEEEEEAEEVVLRAQLQNALIESQNRLDEAVAAKKNLEGELQQAKAEIEKLANQKNAIEQELRKKAVFIEAIAKVIKDYQGEGM